MLGINQNPSLFPAYLGHLVKIISPKSVTCKYLRGLAGASCRSILIWRNLQGGKEGDVFLAHLIMEICNCQTNNNIQPPATSGSEKKRATRPQGPRSRG